MAASPFSPIAAAPPQTVTAGRAIVEALLAAGVSHVFCVPGESFLGVLDALHEEPRIRTIATRHEGAAAFMAEAFGSLTRRPAAVMGTRMVGGGNLLIGVHTARQNDSPLIALLGQVPTEARYRESFQEADLAHVFGPISKWAAEPPAPERLGELVLRGARIATSGRPGPVVLALREDLLDQPVPTPTYAPVVPPRPQPDPRTVARTLALLRSAQRPILLLGVGLAASDALDSFEQERGETPLGQDVAASAREAVQQLAETEGLAVVTAWRRPDLYPNDHPHYLGMAGFGAVASVVNELRQADLVVALGARLDENTMADYTIPGPGASLVHVELAAEELGGHTQAAVVALADPGAFVRALLAVAQAQPIDPALRTTRQARLEQARATWEAATAPSRGRSRPGYADQQAVAGHLRRLLPPDAIVTTDAGNFAGWQRYLRWQQPGTFLGPISGAMGYGLPAAIGARLARPEQPVVALAGDGGFLMVGTELETAVREEVPVVVVVFDNRQYGTIRMYQERGTPPRRVATRLGATDLAQFAQSLGARGFSVQDDATFPAAFQEALASNQPALIHVHVDPEQISAADDRASSTVGGA